MRKIRLIPIENYSEYQYAITPKSMFRQWCFLNGKKVFDVSNEGDYELFDELWEDVKDIFLLDHSGHHATCESYVHFIEDEVELENLCRICKARLSGYTSHW